MRLFEFEDQDWLPAAIREGMTDYLRFILNTGNFYEPVSPLLLELLQATGSAKFIDLCSGGGGTIEQVQENMQQKYAQKISFILTDIFPNKPAYEFIKHKAQGSISYFPLPLNATNVDITLTGTRTIFSSFHHFDSVQAKLVLEDAVAAGEAIGIFDGGDKNIFFVMAILFFHPVTFFLLTPFFRPFKWSRILLTYLIPVIPLCALWDGIVSVIRLYHPGQLLQMATTIPNSNYTWRAGKVNNKFGMRITYLVGYPTKNAGDL